MSPVGLGGDLWTVWRAASSASILVSTQGLTSLAVSLAFRFTSGHCCQEFGSSGPGFEGVFVLIYAFRRHPSTTVSLLHAGDMLAVRPQAACLASTVLESRTDLLRAAVRSWTCCFPSLGIIKCSCQPGTSPTDLFSLPWSAMRLL